MRALLVDIDYVTKAGKPLIRLVMKGKKFFRLYDRFEPYFYLEGADAKSEEKVRGIEAKAKGIVAKVARVEKVKVFFGGKERELLKIFCEHPAHVPLVREEAKKFGKIYEHDIPFARRYLIDKGLAPFTEIVFSMEGRFLKEINKVKDVPFQLRTLAFDIETYNPAGVPREAKDPVIMISYAGKGEGVLTYKKVSKEFAEVLKGEKEIIEKFCDVVRQADTEILVGYNSSAFDLPYLGARAKAVGGKLVLGRDGSSFKLRRAGLFQSAKIVGRIHVDLYPLVRFLARIGALKLHRYTLADAYKEVVGKEKHGLKRLDIWRIWDGGEIGELAEYSLRDAEAALEMAEKLLPMEFEMCKLVRATLFDVYNASSGQLVEFMLMNASQARNEIIPNKPPEAEAAKRQSEQIKGAYVKLPQAGLYENIAVFDFRSLYPSIIISHNVDPSTLNCSCCSEKEAHLSPFGSRFCAKRRGVISEALEEILRKRMEIKKKLKEASGNEVRVLDARQQALKIVANSFYGYLAYARSRWYSKECGESVTAWGRHYIQEAIAKAEKAGFRVLYCDTDSVFLLLGEKKKEDALAFMKKINGELPEKMELELEGFYRRGVFVSKKSEAIGAKKKYALIGEDGKIKIRGFELVRRDWAKIAKDTQMKVLEAILVHGSKEKAAEIVKETVKNVRSGAVPKEELVIYTQLRKGIGNYDVISPEVAAAKKAIARGMPMEEGALVGYIITRKGKSISEKADVAEFAEDYDADYYISHQIIPAVMKIMKELGFSEEDLKAVGKQKNLAGW